MNKLSTLLILFIVMGPGAVFAQTPECKLQRGTDDFSGKPKISTGFFQLQDVQLTIDATGKEIDYFFVISNPAANCIGEQSEALFLFEGGKQKLELKNTGGDNCNGFFHILLRGGQFTPSAMQKLATKKVVSITFSDRNDKKTIVSLNAQQQELLMKMSDCTAKEAKTL